MPEQEANVRPVTPEQAASLPPDARIYQLANVLFPTICVCTLLAPADRSKSIPFSRHEHLDAVLCCTGCRTRGRRHIAETCPHFVVYIASTSLQMPRFPAHHLQQDSPFRG